MRTISAKVLLVPSDTRKRVFGALVAEPRRAWTVRALAELLPDVSLEGLRTTLYLLLGDRLVEPVRHRHALTLRLVDDGAAILTQILATWEQKQ